MILYTLKNTEYLDLIKFYQGSINNNNKKIKLLFFQNYRKNLRKIYPNKTDKKRTKIIISTSEIEPTIYQEPKI